MELKQVDVNSLKAYPENARTHNDKQVAQIAESIKEFGFCAPCLVDEKGVLIAGHGRVMAAQTLGLKTIPTISIEHLTPEQVKAYRLADNQLALNSDWDLELLGLELSQLQEIDLDISVIGFNDAQVTSILSVSEFPVDASKEWEGMPEYIHEDKTAYRSLIIHFADQNAVDKFTKFISKFANITDKTRMIWFPDNTKEIQADKIYADES